MAGDGRIYDPDAAHRAIAQARRQGPVAMGSHLARLELVEALRIITRRMPNPRRSERAHWKQMTGITGPIALPLEFEPGH